MSKGKLIVEIEKADGEIRTANLKIKDMTVEELSNVVGAVLNDVISKDATDEAEKVVWKAHALHDICVQIGFKSIAARLEEAFNKLERESNAD
jgi:hypothetical protein